MFRASSSTSSSSTRVRARGAARAAGAAAALLAAAACGFHLQGRVDLPPTLAAVAIEATDTESDFYRGLRAALQSSGTDLLERRSPDGAAIRILADRTSELVVTVSTRNIPTAYQLTYSVRIAVESGSRELIAPEVHTVSREYSFDETAVLAKQREKDALSAALAADLVTEVMRRLASL